jgi:hypothetical protein
LRTGYLGVVITCYVTLAAGQKMETARPKLSAEPLAVDQIAVYRAVIEYYLVQDPKVTLSLANRTEPLQSSGYFSAGSCGEGFDLEVMRPPVGHKIGPEAVRNLKVTLVDPDIQKKRIADGYRQFLALAAGHGQDKPTDQELKVARKKELENYLFTLSEVAFDKHHRRAVVAYSYLCGGSCGHGGPLLLEKVAGEWMVRKTCGGWFI